MDQLMALLRVISAHDVKIWSEDGRLRFRARHLPAELQERMRAAKGDLLAYLDENQRAITPYLLSFKAEQRSNSAIGFLPTMLGWGLCYRDLATTLPVGLDAFSCRLPGTLAGEEPLLSIEAMALHAGRQFAAAGPYQSWSLVGWSFGGLLALATAREMARAGFNCDRIILIDSYVPTEEIKKIPADERSTYGFLLSLEAFDLAEEVRRENIRGLSTVLDRLLSKTALTQSELARMHRLFLLNTLAVRVYDEPDGPEAVYEIRAVNSRSLTAGANPSWRVVRAKRRRVHEILGDHFSIMRIEELTAVAASLVDGLAWNAGDDAYANGNS